MVHAEETIAIARSPQDVFAILTDLTLMPAWRSNVVEATWVETSGPGAGPGRMKAVTHLLGVRPEWTCDVTTWEPPHRFGYVARSGQQCVEAEFRCDADAACTRLTMVGGGDVPRGRIGAVAAPLYVRARVRENRKSLRAFKTLVERRVDGER